MVAAAAASAFPCRGDGGLKNNGRSGTGNKGKKRKPPPGNAPPPATIGRGSNCAKAGGGDRRGGGGGGGKRQASLLSLWGGGGAGGGGAPRERRRRAEPPTEPRRGKPADGGGANDAAARGIVESSPPRPSSSRGQEVVGDAGDATVTPHCDGDAAVGGGARVSSSSRVVDVASPATTTAPPAPAATVSPEGGKAPSASPSSKPTATAVHQTSEAGDSAELVAAGATIGASACTTKAPPPEETSGAGADAGPGQDEEQPTVATASFLRAAKTTAAVATTGISHGNSSGGADNDKDASVEGSSSSSEKEEESSGSESGDEDGEGEADGPSEYQLLRLRNIARNEARLAALGLLSGNTGAGGGVPSTAAARRSNNKNRRATCRPAKSAVQDGTGPPPTRRSTRIRRRGTDGAAETTALGTIENVLQDAKEEEEQAEEPEEAIFAVSPVVQYEMSTAQGGGHDGNESCSSSPSFWPPYDVTVGDGGGDDGDGTARTCDVTTPSSLVPVGPRLVPPSGLNAIYSLDFFGGGPTTAETTTTSPHRRSGGDLLVGAGKAGIVALWDLKPNRTENDERDGDDASATWTRDPILSWRGHSGRWIASARFLLPAGGGTNQNGAGGDGGGGAPPPRLLTAANDGCVCLWDVSSVDVRSGMPRLLHRTGKELHRSGIFAMDAMPAVGGGGGGEGRGGAYRVCTGSKDKTVALSVWEVPSSPSPSSRAAAAVCRVRHEWTSTHHTGTVKAVALRGRVRARRGDDTAAADLVASASDDGTVAIHDWRRVRGAPVAVLEDAHNRPHSVEWSPVDENVLLTAGHDDTIKTWDVRHAARPICSFRGHVPASGSSSSIKYKKIHHPTFYVPGGYDSTAFGNGGAAAASILTGGEGSCSLSLYRNTVGHSGSFHGSDGHDSSAQTKSEAGVETVFSRGRLVDGYGDAGSVAVRGHRVAVSLEGGDVLLLAPQR